MSQLELDLSLSTVDSENDIQFFNGEHEDFSKTINMLGPTLKILMLIKVKLKVLLQVVKNQKHFEYLCTSIKWSFNIVLS